MNKLKIVDMNGQQTIDSRLVAETLEIQHKNLLQKIRGYEDILEGSKFSSRQFFIPSSYLSEQNKEQPCYMLTKKGCEMVANKITGEKGVIFTAMYVDVFNTMEKQTNFDSLQSQELSPLLQWQIQTELGLKKHDQQFIEVSQEIQDIRDVLGTYPNSWREDTNKLLRRIGNNFGDSQSYQEVRAESYELLEKRMGVNLEIRLTNKRRRMADEGVCKSKRDKLNYLDVIGDDKKLIEGYISIVKELTIKYGGNINEDNEH